ncbi:hypothetical protein BCD64_23335 [Nostoc sp. MBR 210]|nr:hypothetical protein BCD64_23335 [Nostoc sp. MBR 210]
MIRGGVLTVIKGEGILVDLSRILWFKPPQIRQELIDYWKSQGFAEAETLQYTYSDNCLEVKRDLPEYGFLKGTGTLDEQVYNIPF